MTPMEEQRLILQRVLDSGRSQAARNRLGQFATPPALAAEILTYAQRLMPNGVGIRFLDPAFGTGAFYGALLATFPQALIESAIAYEVDSDFAEAARSVWKGHHIQVVNEDFTMAQPHTNPALLPNLLICNPPYVRHHHIGSEDKARLKATAASIAGLRMSGLSGLYCYFMVLSHLWMGEKGVAGWLVPSEFMEVNYGSELKRYLLEKVTLLHIHRFDPNDVQFDDALVSSSVVWIRNETPSKDHSVSLSFGGSLL